MVLLLVVLELLRGKLGKANNNYRKELQTCKDDRKVENAETNAA